MQTLREYFVETLSTLYFEYKTSYVVSDVLRDQGEHALAEWWCTERAKYLAQQGTLMDVAGVIGFNINDISDEAEAHSGRRFEAWLGERNRRMAD